MNTLFLLKSAGLAVSMFVASALVASPNRTERGRYFLSIVCLQASLLFLKDIVEQGGGPEWLTTFLIFANFLFGLPSLYLFMRVTYGDPARRPLLHYLPCLVNLPAAVVVARGAIGSAGIDGAIPPGSAAAVFVPIFYINILALGETFQLVHYAGASLRYLQRKEGGARERIYTRIVLGVAACYAVYHAVRWIGFGIRIANARGGGFPQLSPWVNPASMIFLALFIGLAGVYVVTRPELLLGSRETRMRPKYGGKPFEQAEAADIVDKAAELLSSCVDLSPESMDSRRLAKLLGVPYYLLSRAVNEHKEQTVADLIREKRVLRAKALLDECPDATILRIALEAGFPAKSSFNDAFKKTVGMSPSEYRRQQKRLDNSSQIG